MSFNINSIKKSYKRRDIKKYKSNQEKFSFSKKEPKDIKINNKDKFKRDRMFIKNNKEVCVVASFHSPTFSGRIGSELLRVLRNAGLKVTGSDRFTYPTQKGFSFGEDIEEILMKPECGQTKIWVSTLNDLPLHIIGKTLYIVTSFDLNFVEKKDLLKLKKFKHIWVPTTKHWEECVKVGIDKKNISLFDIPIASAFVRNESKINELKQNDSFKFVFSSSPTYKSGLEEVLLAYIKEFKSSENVELILKLTHIPNLTKNHSFEILDLKKRLGALNKMFAKVTVINQTLVDSDYVDLMSNADVYVSANILSGSNVRLAEAMALGLPIIAPNWQIKEINRNYDGFYAAKYIKTEIEAGKLFNNSKKQCVYKIDINSLSALMREAIKHHKNITPIDTLDFSKIAEEIKFLLKC